MGEISNAIIFIVS